MRWGEGWKCGGDEGFGKEGMCFVKGVGWVWSLKREGFWICLGVYFWVNRRWEQYIYGGNDRMRPLRV